MPEHLRRGDVVNLRPEYAKYALGSGDHYGEGVSGNAWVVEWIWEVDNSADRFVAARPLHPNGSYLKVVNGYAVNENFLVRNEFLTAAYRATSEPRHED